MYPINGLFHWKTIAIIKRKPVTRSLSSGVIVLKNDKKINMLRKNISGETSSRIDKMIYAIFDRAIIKNVYING
jgi:hypothetical protein